MECIAIVLQLAYSAMVVKQGEWGNNVKPLENQFTKFLSLIPASTELVLEVLQGTISKQI